MEDAKTLERQKRATAPPKRWVNWWHANDDHQCLGIISGKTTRRQRGDVWCGSRTYPSKDVAESAVADIVRDNLIKGDALEYLGPYPEGERP